MRIGKVTHATVSLFLMSLYLGACSGKSNQASPPAPQRQAAPPLASPETLAELEPLQGQWYAGAIVNCQNQVIYGQLRCADELRKEAYVQYQSFEVIDDRINFKSRFTRGIDQNNNPVNTPDAKLLEKFRVTEAKKELIKFTENSRSEYTRLELTLLRDSIEFSLEATGQNAGHCHKDAPDDIGCWSLGSMNSKGLLITKGFMGEFTSIFAAFDPQTYKMGSTYKVSESALHDQSSYLTDMVTGTNGTTMKVYLYLDKYSIGEGGFQPYGNPHTFKPEGPYAYEIDRKSAWRIKIDDDSRSTKVEDFE